MDETKELKESNFFNFILIAENITEYLNQVKSCYDENFQRLKIFPIYDIVANGN